MSKKKKNNKPKPQGGFVFSTNPDFEFETDDYADETLPNNEQDLRIWLERKGGNKITTVIKNFVGNENDLKDLGKTLKSLCGSGGTVKDNEIIVQGDHRDKVLNHLVKNGYRAKKSGG
jgi:translation initiation factor 1